MKINTLFSQMSLKYSDLDDSQRSAAEHTEEITSDTMEVQWYWYVLGMAIDRFMFLIYCIILGGILAKHM